MFDNIFNNKKKKKEEKEKDFFDSDNNFRIDKTSKRMIFSNNSILNSNNMNNTKYLIVKELGAGVFSNVYLAYAKNKNNSNFDYKNKYVLKTTRSKNLYAQQAVKEYQYFNKLDNKSKYIIHYFDFFNIPNKTSIVTPCLVLEYFNDNFYTYMKNNFRNNYGLNVDILLIVTKAMILGIDFLHKNEIIHCDLKPENIVIDNKNQCKIIDLGSAIKFGYYEKDSYMQSRYYRAPNCIVSCDINPRIDYWSIGCIMYEALTMIPLFAKTNERQVLMKQLRFIEIPQDKINYNSQLMYSLWNFQTKNWEFYIDKIYLFDYLATILKLNYIDRISEEKDWLIDINTGYYSLIKMCILDHYNEEDNDYVKQLEIVEASYKTKSKFPPIATI